ncbi:MAG: PKD domain-containing protein, partial [Thermoplasmata archaeon]
SVSSNGSVEHLYAGAGTYVVSVTVRDGAGWELVQSVNLTVESPLTPPAIAWYNGTVGTALALFGLAGIGLAGFAILVRRLLEEEPATPPRRRPPSKPPIALFGPEVGPPGEQPRAPPRYQRAGEFRP